jgi:hypothetical protein
MSTSSSPHTYYPRPLGRVEFAAGSVRKLSTTAASRQSQESKLDTGDDAIKMAIVLNGDPQLPNYESLRVHFGSDEADFPASENADRDGCFVVFSERVVCVALRIADPCLCSEGESLLSAAEKWPTEWETARFNKSHVLMAVSSGASGQTRDLLFQRLVGAVVASVSSPLGIHSATSGTLSNTKDWSASSGGQRPPNSYYRGIQTAVEGLRAHLQANSWSKSSGMQALRAFSGMEAAMKRL